MIHPKKDQVSPQIRHSWTVERKMAVFQFKNDLFALFLLIEPIWRFNLIIDLFDVFDDGFRVRVKDYG